MDKIKPASTLDVVQIRQDFPILDRQLRDGTPLIYLDSTATSQKPQDVLDAMDGYYRLHNANIHRGIHTLAEEATAGYEAARTKLADFIGAKTPREIIYTRNTTESINLVVHSWGSANLNAGDLVVLTELEHHSNIVPWQILASQIGFEIAYIEVTPEGRLDEASFEALLARSPKVVAFAHMSNVVGTITPAKTMTAKAHAAGAIVVIDGAQSVPHFPVDVVDLDFDFMAFSSHKMCGPTGIGILYGKEALLNAMPPFLGGGEMIKRVKLHSFSTNDLPHKFEAGTPAIAEAFGFGAAVDYLNEVGMEAVAAHEHAITEYALERLEEIPGVWVFGPEAHEKGGVAAFTLDDVHPHDISEILDTHGVAIRAGHHCAMPLHEKFDIPATARASFYLYTSFSEVDKLVEAIYDVKRIFS